MEDHAAGLPYNEKTHDELLAYSDRVRADGFYLSLLDIVMLANTNNKKVMVVFNTEEPLTVVSSFDVLQQLLPEGFSICDKPELDSDPSSLWYLVLTRADSKPATQFSELNHWLPCWRKSQVSEASFNFGI